MTLPTDHLYKGDFTSVRLGLCQVQTEPWKCSDNFDRAIRSIEQAAKDGAQIAITPECVIHGYGALKNKQDLIQLAEAAEPVDGEKITVVKNLAKKHSIFISFGFAEKQEGRIYNSAAFISDQGQILYTYRKVHCRDFESIEHGGGFTPGEEFYAQQVPIEGNLFGIGTMICFDREIPESLRCLRAAGSELVLCPLATNTSDMLQKADRADNEMITRCRAAENEIYIAVVNHAGRFNGGSFVVGPSGELVTQLGEDPCTCVVEIPLGIISTKFHSRPLGWMGWGFRRPQVYRKYLD